MGMTIVDLSRPGRPEAVAGFFLKKISIDLGGHNHWAQEQNNRKLVTCRPDRGATVDQSRFTRTSFHRDGKTN